MAKSEYKPLLFTTTVRNPSRFKRYLFVLNKFKGQILTDALATKICGEAMRFGIYRPLNRTIAISEKWPNYSQGDFAEEVLTDAEVSWMLAHNPQNHKEAGFSKGWPSRFATIFMAVRQFGFAYINPGEAITISDIGGRLVNNQKVSTEGGVITVEDGNSKNDTDAFLHAMVKYHRDNPYLRTLNRNVPIVLLLKVIMLLNANPKNNGCGISRRELPILIFWKDDDAQAAYDMIMDIRMKHGYFPSEEVIRSYCIDNIMGGNFKKFKLASLINEYPDEYIRKMRYTGLISLRGGGRFVDINKNEQVKVDYIIDKYSEYVTYTSCLEYYKYVSTVDQELLGIGAKAVDKSRSESLLAGWASKYSWEKIKEEMMLLANHVGSTDPLLKFLDAPVRLEFLTAIAVKQKRPAYRVSPNYNSDDEGLPTSTAGGNQGDIECYGDNNVLVEVTLSKGRVQFMMEGFPVKRHLDEFSQKNSSSSCVFIAPEVYTDTRGLFEWVAHKDRQYVEPFDIKDFVEELEKKNDVFGVKSE